MPAVALKYLGFLSNGPPVTPRAGLHAGVDGLLPWRTRGLASNGQSGRLWGGLAAMLITLAPMRFVTFHYMTYQGIDSDKVVKDHGVGWVDLSNSFCDPEIMAANYEEYIDQAVYAEELGFDGVAVNEHHQTPFGSMPAPNIIAAVLTQRTSRVRICVFGNALPLRATPLSSLEEYTMLDLLSKGRLEAGFVVGGGPEYYSFALNPTDAREKFGEALDLVRKAWSEPGPFRWDGQHYQFDSVNLWPTPYQQPHPPIWLCGVGSPSTLETVRT